MQLTAVRNLALIALVVGLLAGGAVGWASSGDDDPSGSAAPVAAATAESGSAKVARPADATVAPTTTQGPADAAPTEDARRNAVSGALSKGIKDAVARYPGSAEAAVWAEEWDEPVVRAFQTGATEVSDRSSKRLLMWSMSKAVTAVALLRATDNQPSESVREALAGALTGSENCRQRRVILELQRFMGGPEGAATAVREVLGEAEAGTSGITSDAVASEDETCIARLRSELGWTGPARQPALQLGIDSWTIGDAVRFARHLATGGYGRAGEQVLRLLRQPKRESREVPSSNFTAPLTWGAGAAFAGVAKPAYKAGWGGTASRPSPRPYVAGQVIAVTVGGVRYGIAVYYHPTKQPPNDDPGTSDAPEALAAILQPLVRKLAQRSESTTSGAAER